MIEKRRQFDLIVWDWDGTLADSTGMIARAIVKAAQEVGLPSLELGQARNVIGLGIRDAIRTLFPSISSEQAQALTRRYTINYYAAEEDVLLFEGAMALIAELKRKGFKQAIATGKGRRGLNTALQRLDMEKYFHATRTADECFSKPHPQMLDELMDFLVVTPERTLMIGDTTYDMLMAKNADVQSLAVSYGAHRADELLNCQPKALFNTFDELSTWLINNA